MSDTDQTCGNGTVESPEAGGGNSGHGADVGASPVATPSESAQSTDATPASSGAEPTASGADADGTSAAAASSPQASTYGDSPVAPTQANADAAEAEANAGQNSPVAPTQANADDAAAEANAGQNSPVAPTQANADAAAAEADPARYAPTQENADAAEKEANAGQDSPVAPTQANADAAAAEDAAENAPSDKANDGSGGAAGNSKPTSDGTGGAPGWDGIHAQGAVADETDENGMRVTAGRVGTQTDKDGSVHSELGGKASMGSMDLGQSQDNKMTIDGPNAQMGIDTKTSPNGDKSFNAGLGATAVGASGTIGDGDGDRVRLGAAVSLGADVRGGVSTNPDGSKSYTGGADIGPFSGDVTVKGSVPTPRDYPGAGGNSAYSNQPNSSGGGGAAPSSQGSSGAGGGTGGSDGGASGYHDQAQGGS